MCSTALGTDSRPRRPRSAFAVTLVLSILASPLWVAAQDSFAACDPDTSARLTFIENRLEGGERYAQYWWVGWTSFYGLGTVVSSVRAGLENDRGDRAGHTVSAVKALIGTARLLYAPPNAKEGADAMRAVEPSSPEACRRRLEIGEKDLRTNAKESQSRYSWLRHVSIVGFNAAGALIVAEGFKDREDAWVSAGIGVAVGEIMTWTHPWWGDEDLDEYNRSFGAPGEISWQIVPTLNGVALQARF